MGRGEGAGRAQTVTARRSAERLTPLGRGGEHGNYKASAIFVLQRQGRELIFKIPGARMTADGRLVSWAGALGQHGIDRRHALRAEPLAGQAAQIMGLDAVVAEVRQETLTVPGTGPVEGLVIERLDGRLAQVRSGIIPTPQERAAAERLWRPEAANEEEWNERLRALMLLDSVIGNTDRHGENIMLTERGPVGFDQGMAFAPDTGMIFHNHALAPAIARTGGAALRADELQRLERLRDSDWLDQLEAQLGEQAAREARERLDYMLREKVMHPRLLGSVAV